MSRSLGLFDATGVELEYMIVDRETLDVRPIADRVLEAVGGHGETEVRTGRLAWSNELALHIVELKTAEPAPSLEGLAGAFADDIERIDAILAPHGARLMPTAMHPWMDPHTELVIWPHEQGPIYRAFDRIFDCRGHGWANLQSTHINLPFANDEEFGKLHAAIRMILPVLPALAASSPFADGRASGLLDTRMEYYRHNADRIASVAGHIVPEPVYSRADYEGRLLQGIYDDLAPLDPEGILRFEWVNARGAIARFDRGAIEIRVLDVQECPTADLAVCAAVVGTVRALVEGRLGDPEAHRRMGHEALGALFVAVLRTGEATPLPADYLRALGLPRGGPRSAGELWRHLVATSLAGMPGHDAWSGPLGVLLEEGCLARRLLARTGPAPDRARLAAAYRELCDCLVADRLYRAAG